MNCIKSLLGQFQPYNRVKTPIILQFSQTECGLAALAIIFSYYKVTISLETLREKCGTSRDGCRALTLINVAKNYGFDAAAFKMDIDDIVALKAPVIAFWNFSHYVVINGAGTNKIFINDPSHGTTTVSLTEFDKSFTGIVICLWPTDNVINVKKKSIIMSLLQQWLSGFQTALISIFLCSLIIIGGLFLSSCLTTIFIDYCVIANNINMTPYLALLTATSAIVVAVSMNMQRWRQFKLCSKASIAKTSKVISHILRLPLQFYALREKSELIAIFARVELIVNLLFKNTVALFVSLVTAIGSFIFMVNLDAVLAMVSLTLFFITAILFFLISRINLSYEKYNINALAKFYAHAISSIKNIETIKVGGLENKVLTKWHALFCQKIMTNDKSNTVNAMTLTLNKLSDAMSPLAILFLGGIRMDDGYISVGNLMAYYALHLLFCNSANAIFQSLKDSQNAYASHIRINDIMHYAIDNRFSHAKKSECTFDKKCPIIACQNVYFYYNKTSTPTLADINLEIQSGQHIALVGSTGSGKSTLAKILSALYYPHAGEIKIWGRQFHELSSTEFAHYFSTVSQETSLFSGTIYDNLTLWKNNYTPDEINRALKMACLEELIAQRSLHGKVAENGHNFSGGEKQRIDIARALIQKTPLLILDEATSALDIQTEKRLITNLRMCHKTIIYVAHRLSTIKHCDQIIVMENGRIVEHGHHHNLSKNRGLYYHLVQSEHDTKNEL